MRFGRDAKKIAIALGQATADVPSQFSRMVRKAPLETFLGVTNLIEEASVRRLGDPLSDAPAAPAAAPAPAPKKGAGNKGKRGLETVDLPEDLAR